MVLFDQILGRQNGIQVHPAHHLSVGRFPTVDSLPPGREKEFAALLIFLLLRLEPINLCVGDLHDCVAIFQGPAAERLDTPLCNQFSCGAWSWGPLNH